MEFIDPNKTPNVADMNAVTGTKEDQARFAIETVERCDYVKEKLSGQIHKYSERFAERGDLVKAYHPSIAERLKLGEDIMDLFNRGATIEDFRLANVPEDTLKKYGLLEVEAVHKHTESSPVPVPPAAPALTPAPSAAPPPGVATVTPLIAKG